MGGTETEASTGARKPLVVCPNAQVLNMVNGNIKKKCNYLFDTLTFILKKNEAPEITKSTV